MEQPVTVKFDIIWNKAVLQAMSSITLNKENHYEFDMNTMVTIMKRSQKLKVQK